MPTRTEASAIAPEVGAAALDCILSRRSVPPRHLKAPGPTSEQLARIVQAAATAPDHRGLRPYRFLEIADRTAFAEAFVVAETELNLAPTAEDLTRARERAGHAPCLLAVVTRTDEENGEVTVEEQIASAGAALAYLLLAAHAMGFGAMAVSGDKVHSRTLRASLGLAENEALLCFVGIGTAAKARGPRVPAPAGLLTRWQP